MPVTLPCAGAIDMSFYRQKAKRWMDLVLTVPTALFLLPLLGIIALAVAVALGRPVLFRQRRPGLNGRPFDMLKFRSMHDGRDAAGALLPDSERLTGFGRWLRSTSLDELPEVWNVLKGDMSLVGPRPLLMQYLEEYSPAQMRRHDVPPGITGWAQVNGRNDVTWEKRFELDTWYVDHVSFWLDLKILGMTISRVLKREGVSQPGQATMPPFKGQSRDNT